MSDIELKDSSSLAHVLIDIAPLTFVLHGHWERNVEGRETIVWLAIPWAFLPDGFMDEWWELLCDGVPARLYIGDDDGQEMQVRKAEGLVHGLRVELVAVQPQYGVDRGRFTRSHLGKEAL